MAFILYPEEKQQNTVTQLHMNNSFKENIPQDKTLENNIPVNKSNSLEKDISDSYKYLHEYKQLKNWLKDQGDSLYEMKSTKITDIPSTSY